MDITNWMPYQGEYEKEFYDVRTADGREYAKCWPNDGDFFTSTKAKTVIPGDDVTHFRFFSALDS